MKHMIGIGYDPEGETEVAYTDLQFRETSIYRSLMNRFNNEAMG